MTRPQLTTSLNPPAATNDRGHRVTPGPWPASPLAAVGRAFDLLVGPPTTYLWDGTIPAGLGAGPVELSQLRRSLLAAQTPAGVRDTVWQELVERSRRPAPEGQTWTVIAAGVALPGLTAAAARLCRGWRGETADIDAEMLAGFVGRLRTLDLRGPRVVGRLIDAAVRAGRRARNLAGDSDVVRVDQAWSRPPTQPWDHPDWVLACAVAAGVLDRTEARLIGATRLEDVALADAAAALRVDPHLAADWRWRAEGRLREALAAGEIDTSRTRGLRPVRDAHAARLALAKAARNRRRQSTEADRRALGKPGTGAERHPAAE